MTTLLRFPTERVEHEECPKCGARVSAFERLGSGTCNECLSKRIKRNRRKHKFAR